MAKILTFNRKKPSPQLGPPKESVQRKNNRERKKPTFCIVCKIIQKAFMMNCCSAPRYAQGPGLLLECLAGIWVHVIPWNTPTVLSLFVV